MMVEDASETRSQTQQTQAQQAADCLSYGDYAQAVEQYQALVEAQPDVKAHYWHLGLASLLLGEEAEAQTTWMVAMMDGDAEQIEQWSAELAAVLRSQAEQQASGNPRLAWVIRQHLREIVPHDLPNLFHLIQLSVQLEQFTGDYVTDWDVVSVLQSATTVDSTLLLQTLDAALHAAPLEPVLVDFAAAGLEHTDDPQAFVHTLMLTAVKLAYALHCSGLAVRHAELCLQVFPQDLQILSHLSTFYQNTGQHEQGIATAKEFGILARSLSDQVFGSFLLLRALTHAGGYWKEIFALVTLQDSLFLALAESQTTPLDKDDTLRLMTTTFFLPYARDDLARNRFLQNRLFQLHQFSIRAYAAEPAERYQQGLAARRANGGRAIGKQTNGDGKRRLRVGYLSHCLRRHSVGWLARWLFQYHDREQFEIYGYFWNYQFRKPDHLQEWFVDHVDHARKLERDGLAIAEQIYQDEIDLLIDLDSITADVCCEVMALKPAPVQATWLGWDASGIPAIDYFIADPYVLSTKADVHYAEKIWRLPQTYIAVDGFEIGVPTLRREDLEIPADAVIYLSGQSSFKRHPDTVRSQLRIIAAVPNSYLLIKGITDEQAIQNYFSEVAEAEGVSRDRLRFLPEVATEAVHRANLSIADVVLDTYPYNGATTTLETLWMGIPLVTRVGEQFASRNSYTMMMNAGIEEGIAWTEEEYVEWGVRFGKDPALRQQVAWKMGRSRQTAPLWNAKQFTREMEHAYQQMCAKYNDA